MKLGDSLGRNRKRRKRKKDGFSSLDKSQRAEDSSSSHSDGNGGRVKGGVGLAAISGRALFGGFVVLVVGGWCAGYGLATRVFFPTPPSTGDLYEVPDVRGLGLASAEERLAGAGLELGQTDSITHPTVAAGVLLGQSPLPGQLSRPDEPVYVTMSIGPQMRSVPDVLSLDQASARVVLETGGFVVEVDSVEAEEVRGQVVGLSPPPDSMVALPAEIRLIVSTGPPLVLMPAVLGLKQAEAEILLDSLGLDVVEVEEVFRFGRDQGVVVEQEPAAASELERGSGVRLKVGRRAGQIEK